MKTTLEIPDELMRQIKIRAAERNQKMKDVVTELLETGMESTSTDTRKSKLPMPLKLKRF